MKRLPSRSVRALAPASFVLRLTADPPVRTEEDADELAGDEVAAIQPFHPDFTYPIFGDKETIFGYRNPDIKVRT